ncbi:MAG TPA: hypothetical protein VFE30_11540 [Anaeromyxobacteraceae bacterium]|jgi:hypothetical protein|nr:hypothetical protein [Anaeromyxobacteraceae bacterium]
MPLKIALLIALALSACNPNNCDPGCTGSNGSCESCPSPYSCNSGGICSSVVNGVACCTGGSGGGGGGGGGSCNAGYCVSNGACCPAGSPYYCRGSCYVTYNDLLHAGCTTAVQGTCY